MGGGITGVGNISVFVIVIVFDFFFVFVVVIVFVFVIVLKGKRVGHRWVVVSLVLVMAPVGSGGRVSPVSSKTPRLQLPQTPAFVIEGFQCNNLWRERREE